MSGWSVTTSSSPRSAPAASSATSPTPTERSGSPSCTGSPTPPKAPPPSPSATAGPKRSASTSTSERVHVGDLTALTEEVFAAWQTDRSSGLDAIMLAPTRDLVSQLNQRARAHRLDHRTGQQPSPTPVRVAMLADGNPASVGELVITRTNNRPSA